MGLDQHEHRSQSQSPVKTVFIAGYGRSGSTLLDRILGSVESIFSAGELSLLWEKARDDDYPCSCRAKLNACPFWVAVFDEVFGPSDHRRNIDDTDRLFRSVVQRRRFPVLLLPSLRSQTLRARVTELLAVLDRLYRAIKTVSQAEIVVDSSKNALYGALLSELSSIDLSVVHVIRDSRAVAYSQVRSRYDPNVRKHTVTRSPLRSALGWNFYNTLVEAWRASGTTRYQRLRYEDLVRSPRRAARDLLEGLDLSLTLDSFVSETRVELSKRHICAGNVMRFKEGEIDIKLDREWQTEQRLTHRALVTSLTWPLLLRHGYGISG
jgi:hypothetical protein